MLDLNQNVYPYTKEYVIEGIFHLCPKEKEIYEAGITTDLPTLINHFAFFLLTQREVYTNPTSVSAKYLLVIKQAARDLSENGFFNFEGE